MFFINSHIQGAVHIVALWDQFENMQTKQTTSCWDSSEDFAYIKYVLNMTVPVHNRLITAQSCRSTHGSTVCHPSVAQGKQHLFPHFPQTSSQAVACCDPPTHTSSHTHTTRRTHTPVHKWVETCWAQDRLPPLLPPPWQVHTSSCKQAGVLTHTYIKDI